TAGAMRNAVRDVAEQELLASAHAHVSDDQDVGVLGLRGGDDKRRRLLSGARGGGPGAKAWTTVSVAPKRRASSAPHVTAYEAVSERSDATTTRSITTEAPG